MPFKVLRRSFYYALVELLHDSRSIGIVLLACTVVSLLISNLLGGESYLAFWHREYHFFEPLHLPNSIIHWINDGLMAVFFLLVGMEIKREVLEGELSTLKKALLPLSGALGGMVAPAIIFLLFTAGTAYTRGWGIPMATDIAFSLGIASLLGKKVPMGLKIFLTALAIIDDLGAILVIAIFYGSTISFWYLGGCLIIVTILFFLNKTKIKLGAMHFFLGVVLWFFMYNSGIHATVAGVLLAGMIPLRFLNRLEHILHHPVYFLIMPVFALANTAIIIPAGGIGILNGALPWGIMLGLFIGKPLGIVLATWAMVKTKLAELPSGINWRKMFGAGMLAGIGFTMSIFIASLAFENHQLQDISKIAVLASSFAAMILGFFWLYTGVKWEEVDRRRRISKRRATHRSKRF